MTKLNKPHYFYKVLSESVTGKVLQAFMKKCQYADDKAREWAERQGADHYYESPMGMAGGVACVEFDNCIGKEGWEKIDSLYSPSCFMPTDGSELEKEMYSLPVVSEAELIDILQFAPSKSKDGKPLPFTFGNTTPLVFLHHDSWYIDVPYECKSADCLPISEKKFYRRRMAAINERF